MSNTETRESMAQWISETINTKAPTENMPWGTCPIEHIKTGTAAGMVCDVLMHGFGGHAFSPIILQNQVSAWLATDRSGPQITPCEFDESMDD